MEGEHHQETQRRPNGRLCSSSGQCLRVLSGQFLKMEYFGRPRGLILMPEKDERPPPLLTADPLCPLFQVGLSIAGTAQPQVPPGRRADKLLGWVVVAVRSAEAMPPGTEQLSNTGFEPSLVAELEGTPDSNGNQVEKSLQSGEVRPCFALLPAVPA